MDFNESVSYIQVFLFHPSSANQSEKWNFLNAFVNMTDRTMNKIAAPLCKLLNNSEKYNKWLKLFENMLSMSCGEFVFYSPSLKVYC